MSFLTKKKTNSKKKTLKSSQASTERVQNLRFEYWQQVKKIKPEDLVFIDEMGANLALSRGYARSFQGTRAYSQQPFYPGKHLTLIGAIAIKGFLGGMTLEGGTNGTAFQVFADQVLIPQLWPGACVVMDNLPAHKVKGIRDKIESVGASLIYLSPYSPDFNPIENCWSKLKAYLRKVAARSRELLEEAIGLGLDLITENDIKNWFTHCCYCT